jgi:hypothetical protein
MLETSTDFLYRAVEKTSQNEVTWRSNGLLPEVIKLEEVLEEGWIIEDASHPDHEAILDDVFLLEYFIGTWSGNNLADDSHKLAL